MKTVSESAFSQSEIGQRDLTLLEGAKRWSLRSDHSNDNDNATNQWFDWLNEAKEACYTCSTHFGAIFWRSLSNDDVKFSYLSFRRQCESAAENLFYSPPLHEKPSCQASECTLRLFRATWPIWNNRKTLNLTQSFRCNSRRSFLHSLLIIGRRWNNRNRLRNSGGGSLRRYSGSGTARFVPAKKIRQNSSECTKVFFRRKYFLVR